MTLLAASRALHVLVMAKAPVPGRVKTRLCPPCTFEQAAAIAAAALADTLAAVVACRATRKVLALDGEPGPWLPPGVEVIRQRGCRFDERLVNAWTDMASLTGGWGVQIGMDTPQVTASLLDDQLALLDGARRLGGAPTAVLGGAADGGWWVIGLPGTDPAAVFRGVPMSTSVTGAAQARRLRSLGLEVMAAPELVDVDDIEDLACVAAGIPNSLTAAAARAAVPRLFTGSMPIELSA